MRTPLSILSRGRLAGGLKKPLAILSIGWLVFTSTPQPPANIPEQRPYYMVFPKDDVQNKDKKIIELNNLIILTTLRLYFKHYNI